MVYFLHDAQISANGLKRQLELETVLSKL